MAEIALPAYLEEINSLIDEGRSGEATVHARHILEHYPSQVDVYRLLAKALLEQSEFEDAADLFQRVLSVYPDDFISHVGLAIVRKNEGHVKQALWHMERAFEIEPYNLAVRAELNDLYGRRDGMPPEQLVLNRPALARLYVTGEMYPQAIAELREILAEADQRLDLQVLLAEALWRIGRRVDAVDACLEVLDQLPNCVLANAIVADVWLSTGRMAEAQPYLRRVQRLKQLSQADLRGDAVVTRPFKLKGAYVLPEKVLVERLPEEVALGIVEGDAAEWVGDVGIEDSEADLDWLQVFQETEAKRAETSGVNEERERGGPEGFGDEKGVDEVVDGEGRMPGLGQPAGEDSEETVDASVAGDGEDEALERTGAEEAVFEDTIAGEPAGEESAAEPVTEDTWEDAADAEPAETTDWLQLFEEEAGDLGDASAWLSGSDEEIEELAAEETDWEEWLEADAETGGAQALPDWLVETTDSDAALESELPGEDADDSTTSVHPESIGTNEESELEEVAMGSSEEPRKEEPEEETPKTDAPEVPEPGDQEDDLDWLRELGEVVDEDASAQGGEGEAGPAGEVELPDWLRDEMAGEAEAGDSLEWFEEEEEHVFSESGETVIDSSADALSAPDDESDSDEATFDDEDLSWLDQIAAGEGQPIEEPPTFSWPEDDTSSEEQATDADAGDETPEELEEALAWLEQLAEQEEVDPDYLASVEQLANDEEEAAELFEEMPDDAEEAMAWLEELAAEEGDVGEESRGDLPEDVDEEPAMISDSEVADEDEALEWLDELTSEEEVEAEEWLSEWVDEEPVGFEEEETPAEPADAGDVISVEVAASGQTEIEDTEDRPSLHEEEAEATEVLPEGDAEELRSLGERDLEAEGAAPDEEAEDEDLTSVEEFVAEGDEEELATLEATVSTDEPELPADSEEEAAAEALEDETLPDWLSDMAPAESEIEESGEDVALRALLASTEGADAEDEEVDDARIEAAVEEFFSDVAEGELDEAEWLDSLGDEEGVPDTTAEDEALEAAIAATDEDEDLHGWLEEAVDEEEVSLRHTDLPEDQEEALDSSEIAAEQAETEETETIPPEKETDVEPTDPGLVEDLAWMETLVEMGEDEGIGPAADVMRMVEGDEDEVPEDLEEAMAWLEQLAAQQGAPLDELPSMQQGGQPPETPPGETDVEGRAEEPQADEMVPAADETEAQLEGVAAEQRSAPEEGDEPTESVEEIDEAMLWLERLASQAAPAGADTGSQAEPSELSAEIPDDPAEALAWLEQLAGRPDSTVSGEPAYAAEIVEEPATPAMAHDISPAETEEAVEEVPDTVPDKAPQATDEAVIEEEMLEEIPDDPDEAMAWLEQLAARQGAPLEELPSVQEVAEEIDIPEWVAREAEREEAEAELAPERAAPEESAEPEADDELDWLDEVEAVQPVDDFETPPAPESPESSSAFEVEEESSDFDLDLPGADIEDSLPEWLGMDETDEDQWGDVTVEVGDWLAAEDEVSQEEPEFEPAPERQPPVEPRREAGVAPPATGAEAAAAEPPPLSPVPPGIDVDEEQLASGREAINADEYDRVVTVYQSLLDSEQGLSLIIADLETAVARAGDYPRLSRLLGDAYMRNGQLQKALESYRKALDML